MKKRDNTYAIHRLSVFERDGTISNMVKLVPKTCLWAKNLKIKKELIQFMNIKCKTFTGIV